MDAITCIMTRRSCKRFLPDMPTDEQIKTVLDAARYAPSGMGSQSWHFTVITNKSWLERVNSRAAKVVLPPSLASNLERNKGKGYSCNYHSPVLIVVSANPTSPTPLQDCACALENMFLAAHAIGLGACWINQLGGKNAEHFKELFAEAGVPSGDLVYACCALGVPEGGLKAPDKRAEGSVIFYN